MIKEVFRVNDDVVTPNGPGVLDCTMYADGFQYYVVRHILSQMTQRPPQRCLTPKSLEEPPRYRTGLWLYNPNEVAHA